MVTEVLTEYGDGNEKIEIREKRNDGNEKTNRRMKEIWE